MPKGKLSGGVVLGTGTAVELLCLRGRWVERCGPVKHVCDTNKVATFRHGFLCVEITFDMFSLLFLLSLDLLHEETCRCRLCDKHAWFLWFLLPAWSLLCRVGIYIVAVDVPVHSMHSTSFTSCKTGSQECPTRVSRVPFSSPVMPFMIALQETVTRAFRNSLQQCPTRSLHQECPTRVFHKRDSIYNNPGISF